MYYAALLASMISSSLVGRYQIAELTVYVKLVKSQTTEAQSYNLPGKLLHLGYRKPTTSPYEIRRLVEEA